MDIYGYSADKTLINNMGVCYVRICKRTQRFIKSL